MTLVNLEEIFSIAAQRWASVSSVSASDSSSRIYREAWQVFNRYVRSVMSEGKALHLSSFCTVCLTFSPSMPTCRLVGFLSSVVVTRNRRVSLRSGSLFFI